MKIEFNIWLIFHVIISLMGLHAKTTYRTLAINTLVSKNTVIHLITVGAIFHITKIISMLSVFYEAAELARGWKITEKMNTTTSINQSTNQ